MYSLEKADLWVYQDFGLNLTFHHGIFCMPCDDESITSMSRILHYQNQQNFPCYWCQITPLPQAIKTVISLQLPLEIIHEAVEI